MADFVRKITRDVLRSAPDAALSREWLVANGLGGYASSSLSAKGTRMYSAWLPA